ncbi:MAG: SDR family NAD(P)-dependent oxidoreductase [Novosphingobium sp.]|nr:SDR family NAD(P)-dependent oxidoreductase [Novosphingobium sp.]
MSGAMEGFDLTGRVAIVTGGGSGIGKATARMLAQRGAHIAIAGRRAEKLEIAAELIRKESGGRCLVVATDVRKPEQCLELMEKVAAEYGQIDILINNAGGAHGHVPLSKMDPSKWDRDVTLNLSAAQYCSQAARPHLKKTRGCIVNVSSLAGMHGTQGVGAYSAAKAGLQMFTKVASAEWGPAGIRVNCIACGMIATEAAHDGWKKSGFDAKGACQVFPLKRYGEMDEAAHAIIFMASDASSYITGETLAVGGGPQIGGMIAVEE